MESSIRVNIVLKGDGDTYKVAVWDDSRLGDYEYSKKSIEKLYPKENPYEKVHSLAIKEFKSCKGTT